MTTSSEPGSPGKLVLPALMLSRFLTNVPPLLISLLLVEIAGTFGQPVGVAAQVRTSASLVSVVVALLMSVLSIRFKHRSLLLVGLFVYIASSLACGIAPSFALLAIAYSVNGLGAAVIAPMSSTMVGDLFSLARRAKAMSYIVASTSLAYLVGSPIIGFIAGIADWRTAFLGYVFPLAVAALVLAMIGVKSEPIRGSAGGQKYIEGFKVILRNRSAWSCLIGPSLSMASWQVVLLYAASFFRQRYSVSLGFISVVNILFSGTYMAGSLLAGRVLDKIGRKKLTVLATGLAGVFITTYTLIPNFLVANALCLIACLFAGIRYTAATSLTLEQVPAYRGTMMSLYTATDQIGMAIGSGLGGALLLMYNYEALGLVLGTLGIIGAGIMQALAIDPTKKQHPE